MLARNIERNIRSAAFNHVRYKPRMDASGVIELSRGHIRAACQCVDLQTERMQYQFAPCSFLPIVRR